MRWRVVQARKLEGPPQLAVALVLLRLLRLGFLVPPVGTVTISLSGGCFHSALPMLGRISGVLPAQRPPRLQHGKGMMTGPLPA